MTIGPEPMTSTRLMSVRLGITLAFPSRRGTAGTGSPRRAVLAPLPDGTARRTPASSRGAALDGAVIQVDVRDLDVFRQRLGIDGEAVVLRRDLHLAGLELLDRMIRAAVPELQLVGRCRPSPATGSGGRDRCRTPARPTSTSSRALCDRVVERPPDRPGRCSGTRRPDSSPAAPTPAPSPETRARRSRTR